VRRPAHTSGDHELALTLRQRVMPPLGLLYFVNYLDRVNISLG
jgi:hypothetical protein